MNKLKPENRNTGLHRAAASLSRHHSPMKPRMLKDPRAQVMP
jgi:hypothetical protein